MKGLTLRGGYFNHALGQVAFLFNIVILCIQEHAVMFVQVYVNPLLVNELWIFRNGRSGVMSISVYLDKHSRMSLNTKDYFFKQISHVYKGVIIVAWALCQLLYSKRVNACSCIMLQWLYSKCINSYIWSHVTTAVFKVCKYMYIILYYNGCI